MIMNYKYDRVNLCTQLGPDSITSLHEHSYIMYIAIN